MSPVNLDLLSQGRTIAVFQWVFLMTDRAFASIDTKTPPGVKNLNYWARCESCKSIDTVADLQLFQQIAPWSHKILDRHFEIAFTFYGI